MKLFQLLSLALLTTSILCCQTNGKKQNISNNDTHDSEIVPKEALQSKSQKDVFGSFVDPRDNRTYKTIKIGGVEWFAENLAYESSESVCFNDTCGKYGRMYSKNVLSNIAPSGWRVATDDDWKKVEILFGMDSASVHKTGLSRGELPELTKGLSIILAGTISSINNKPHFSNEGKITSYWCPIDNGLYFRTIFSHGAIMRKEESTYPSKIKKYVRCVRNIQ